MRRGAATGRARRPGGPIRAGPGEKATTALHRVPLGAPELDEVQRTERGATRPHRVSGSAPRLDAVRCAERGAESATWRGARDAMRCAERGEVCGTR
ncbi:hypothetical protein FFA01_12370 [Frigoribacterium faeni]|uniref:Uncharacterized protein n=1 Tax=Frigoribacterium faeni TaxID=145483 RepID=A0ABQ0UN71_9MICO|nr:hypothetical protein FFA01_12370 [Frigoribacterium faeni]